jgi:hypothetical protein
MPSISSMDFMKIAPVATVPYAMSFGAYPPPPRFSGGSFTDFVAFRVKVLYLRVIISRAVELLKLEGFFNYKNCCSQYWLLISIGHKFEVILKGHLI